MLHGREVMMRLAQQETFALQNDMENLRYHREVIVRIGATGIRR